MHGDLQRVAIDRSRTIQFIQFAPRQLVQRDRVSEKRTGLSAEGKAAANVRGGDVKILFAGIEREHHRSPRRSSVFGILQHVGKIIVIDHQFGWSRLLSETAGHIPQRSFVSVVLSTCGLRPGKREHRHEKQQRRQTDSCRDMH